MAPSNRFVSCHVCTQALVDLGSFEVELATLSESDGKVDQSDAIAFYLFLVSEELCQCCLDMF